MDPETLRADCPGYTGCTYLNTGATGPSPRRVVEAVTACERHHQFDAPCAEGPYEMAHETLAEARAAVASLLGASAEQIALTGSTVDGISQVASAIDWEPGDVVVRTELEHAAGTVPWQHLAGTHGIEIRTVPTSNGHLEMEALRQAVEDARLVCLSSVTWNYGTELPVERVVDIAHDAGAAVLVDAVQSVGQRPVDVTTWGADFVAASGHKWLLGPWGSGFLYVADPTAYEPGRIGYYSVDWNGVDAMGEGIAWQPDARRFELGTTAIAPYAGLTTAIETIQSVGLETIDDRISRLAGRLRDGLGNRVISPPDAPSGLVTFEAAAPEQLVERLAGEGIQIRPLEAPHACRASVHAVNSAADVDALLEAL